MIKMKSEKKTMLSIRLEDDLMARVESCAYFNQENNSDFIRHSLNDATKYTKLLPVDVPIKMVEFIAKTLAPIPNIKVLRNEESRTGTHEKLNIAVKILPSSQMMEINGEFIKILLNELTPEQIKRSALKVFYSDVVQFKQTLFYNDLILEFISEELLKNKSFLLFTFFCLKYFVDEILSDKGRKWFEKCQITRSNDIITFVGKHKGGINYSLFFRHYFENFIDLVPNERVQEPILNSDSIKLTYKLLIDRDEIVNLPHLIQKINEKIPKEI